MFAGIVHNGCFAHYSMQDGAQVTVGVFSSGSSVRAQVTNAATVLLTEFDTAINDLGDGMPALKAVLALVPDDLSAITAAISHLEAQSFCDARLADTATPRSYRRTLQKPQTAQDLTHLLMFAWQKGYLIYRFAKSGGRLTPPAGSVDAQTLHERVFDRVIAHQGNVGACLDSQSRNLLMVAGDQTQALRTPHLLGLLPLVQPCAAAWTTSSTRTMAFGMLAAEE